MAITAVTRKYTPGSHRKSRKTMGLLSLCEMEPDYTALPQSNSVFPIKHVRTIDLLDGIP